MPEPVLPHIPTLTPPFIVKFKLFKIIGFVLLYCKYTFLNIIVPFSGHFEVLFVFCIIFLVLMNFRNSKKISEQQMKITELAQNISIIKEELNEKK